MLMNIENIVRISNHHVEWHVMIAQEISSYTFHEYWSFSKCAHASWKFRTVVLWFVSFEIFYITSYIIDIFHHLDYFRRKVHS